MLISVYVNKKYFIYIILFMIVNISSEFIIKKVEINYISFSFIYLICEICLIFFYIIQKILSKKENEFNEKNQTFKEVIILIICNLIFCMIYFYLLKETINLIKVENYMIMFFFLILIEKKCFKNYFYFHQRLSFIIITILFLYFLINNIIQLKLKLFYLVLQIYSISFRNQLIKLLNMKYFINIYLLGSFNGIFKLIQFFIQYKSDFPQLNLKNIFLIILLFIIIMVNVYLEYKIIYESGPIYRIMVDFISIYISQIIFNEKFDLILIGLLLIICCLIYLEIIQLNFCNLNKNIKINIEKRMNEGIKKEITYSLNDTTINE